MHTIQQESRSFHLLVIIETLSPTQKMVTFTSLLSVANCLCQDLEFRVLEVGRDKESPKHTPTHALPSNFIAPSHVGDAHGLRVRLLGNPTVWSGEIPLSFERTKDSMLVKIPLKVKGESILAWCRVLRQRIGGSVWRLLVVFSPQYMVRSHLPRPLILHVATPSTHTAHQVRLFCLSLNGLFLNPPIFCCFFNDELFCISQEVNDFAFYTVLTDNFIVLMM